MRRSRSQVFSQLFIVIGVQLDYSTGMERKDLLIFFQHFPPHHADCPHSAFSTYGAQVIHLQILREKGRDLKLDTWVRAVVPLLTARDLFI